MQTMTIAATAIARQISSRLGSASFALGKTDAEFLS
jgi:hypothetical protein